MHFSIPSLLGLSFLSLFASTGLAAGISKRSLATNATKIANTEAIVEITQVYALANLLLDEKKYSDLSLVITEDAEFISSVASFSDLPALEEYSRARFLNKITLHVFANLYVYDISATKASAAVNEILVFFGQGNFTGQTFTTYGGFSDTLVKENGSWKISARTVEFQVSPHSMKLGGTARC